MKNTFTFFASLLLLVIFKPIIAQTWTQAGPAGANIVNVQSTTSSLVAVGLSYIGPGGLWLSGDQGLTWDNITGNLDNKLTYNMWTAGDTIFLSKLASYINGSVANDGGLFCSTNNGVNWTQLFVSTFAPPNAYLKIGTTLFFGGNYGINRSTNQGQSWTFLNVQKDVLCFETIGTNIFFGTSSGVFKSTDNCTSWTQISTGIPVLSDNNYKRITGICKIGNTLYISTFMQGVFKSTNLGASWVAVNNGLTDLNLLSIHVSGNTLFAGSYYGGIFKSTDGGATWSAANHGYTNQEVNCFFQFGSKLYAGGSAGIFETMDNGDQWADANENLAGHIIGTGAKTVESVIIKGGEYLFAGTYMGRIYRSADNGTSWQAVGANIRSAASLPFFWAMVANNTNVFVSTYDNILYTSADWGETWTEVVIPFNFTSLSSMEVVDNRLYASFENGRFMYNTDNNGLSWELVNYPPDLYYQNKGKKGNDIFYSGWYDNKVYKMAYGTTTMTYMGQVGTGGTLAIFDIGILGNTLFASVYDGETGVSAGIYQSTDEGANWKYEGLSGTMIRGFTTDENKIFARSEFNIYVRENNSGSWININSDLPIDDQCFYSTGMYANEGKLFAGISSRSLYMADIAQFSAPLQPTAIAGSETPCIGSSQIYSVTSVPEVTYSWQLPAGWVVNSGATTNSVNVTVGSASGIILVIPSNEFGAGAAQFMTAIPVAVLPASVSVAVSADNICAGTVVTYSATPVEGGTLPTYEWFHNEISVATGVSYTSVPVDGDMVYVVMTSNSACATGSPATSNSAAVTVITIDAPIISQAGTTLSSNAPTGNQWYKNGVLIEGATSATYEVTENATYSCIVTINGCSSEVSNSLVVVNVGIANPSAGQFEIFPVPSDGLFTAILASPSAELFTIRVYNNIGILVFEKKDVQVNGTTNQTIDMRPVPSGIYTVAFTSGTSQVVRKIMIKRD